MLRVGVDGCVQDSLVSLSFLQDEVFDEEEDEGRHREEERAPATSQVNEQYLNRVISKVSRPVLRLWVVVVGLLLLTDCMVWCLLL